MATLLGTLTYQKETSLNASAIPNGQLVSGEIMEFFGTYTTTGAEAAADILPIIKLPIGARLRQLWVTSEGVGGTSVVIDSIGDAGSAGRYSTADIALTAASSTELAMTMLAANCLDPFAIDTEANRTIIATLAGSAFSLTASKKIVFRGTYRMP